MSQITCFCRCFTVLLLLLLAFAVKAADTTTPAGFSNCVVLTDEQGEYPLGRHLLILEDPSKTLTIDDVRRPEYAAKFVPSTKEVPGFGFSPSAYWVRIDLDRRTRQEHSWMLEFGYAPMQWLEVYTVSAEGHWSVQKGGSGVPASKRSYRHHKHIFEINLNPDEISSLYLRLDGQSSRNIPLRLYQSDDFALKTSLELSMLSVYAGIIIGLFCYNMFIFLSIGEKAYLFYTLFLAAFLIMTMSLNGISQQLVMPDSPELLVPMIPFSMALSTLFAALFTIRFLSTQERHPRLHRLMQMCIAWSLFSCVAPWMTSYKIGIFSSTLLALIFCSIAFFTAILSVIKGNLVARYYFLAWAFFLAGSIINALRLFGALGTNSFTEYAQLWGSAAEVILLSVALAARMRVMKEENERIQRQQLETQQALNASQQETVAAQEEALNNKQIALDTIQRYSNKLEAEVKARTDELLETQQKLIASEKMAALSVFTAGMAHEINNPANFVSAGAQNAEVEIKKLQSFLGDLLHEDADTDIKQAFDDRFNKITGALDIIKTGVKRIEHVVKNLRATHLENNADFQPVDVVSTMESTWPMLQHTLNIPIEVVSDFRVRPIVPCHIAEIQQVFLALLNNATHAIEDAMLLKGTDYRGKIQLASNVVDDKLIIQIHDNGTGIAEDIQDKIFDPFFTTKVVGRGAGLGLSMARDVVNKHQGSLGVTSRQGEGSTFTLALPLHAPQT